MGKNRFLGAIVHLAFAFLIAAGLGTPVYAGTTGIVAGTVTDVATGEKLAGVNVIVEGTDLTTVTNSSGYYVITNMPPGRYEVTASLVGYADVQATRVVVIMDVTATVDFAMEQSVAEDEEVVVAESRLMVRRDVAPTMYIIDAEEEQQVRAQPANLYQTPGVVLTQPGVIADADGYPHIRGGRGNQIGYMLDGIPITEPVTNAFGTNVVTVGMDKMEIFTGGYRPEYGNAISGVFNQATKTGRTAPGVSLEVTGGSQAFTGVYPQIGGLTEQGLDYYVAAYMWRSEFDGIFYDDGESSDIVGNFTYPVGNNDKLILLMAQGESEWGFPSYHTQTYGTGGLQTIPQEKDHQHQSHLLTALTLNHTINSASFFTLRPYYFRNRWQIEALSDDIGYWWDAESATVGLQFDYTNQLSERHLLKAGTIRMASNNRYWVNVPAFGDYEYTANTDTTQTGLYVQDQMRLSPRWSVEAGLRYDRMEYDKVVNEDSAESQLSPRFGLCYAVDPKTNLRFSWGKMIQFVYTQAMERVYTDAWWDEFYGLSNANLRPERSTQFDFGWERQVSDDMLVQVTPFYRKFNDLLQIRSLDPDSPGAPPYVFDNLGEGTSKGVEMMLRKRPSKNWSGWLSYTLSRAKAQSSSDREMVTPGATQYVDWDQRHTAVLVLNYTTGKWNHSLMAEYGSGLPYNLTDEPTNGRRVSSHTVVNLNFSREITGGWLPQGSMNLSIANLFNTHTVLDRAADGEPTAYVMPRFVALSFTRQF